MKSKSSHLLVLFLIKCLAVYVPALTQEVSCDSNEVCTDRSGEYALCRKYNATTFICFCDTGYYQPSAGENCTSRYNATGCNTGPPACDTPPWECQSDTCQCTIDSFFNVELNSCESKPEDIFDPCAVDADCSLVDPNSVCSNNICICEPSGPSQYFLASKSFTCLPFPITIGDPCELESHCVHLSNSTCEESQVGGEDAWGSCECLDGYSPDEDLLGCSLLELSTTTDPSTETTIASQPTTAASSSTGEPSTSQPTATSPITSQSTVTYSPTDQPSTNLTTTTTKPTLPPGEAQCVSVDQFGIEWFAHGGQVATQTCPGRNEGLVTWFCEYSGKFKGGQPNYTNCSTVWVQQLNTDIDNAINDGSLNLNKSGHFLNIIDGMMADAFQSSIIDPNGNSETQFFGHEIKNIFTLTEKICTNINDSNATVANLEGLVGKSFGISERLLEFEKPWEQLPQKDRTNTFDSMVHSMESIGFNLATNVEENQPEYSSSYGNVGSTYALSVAIAKENTGSDLSFPLNSEQRVGQDSFIKVPSNWRQYTKNATSFVGLEINANFVKDNVPGTIMENTESVDNTRELNSKMMSFTLADSEEMVDFGDDVVEIVFQLEKESWGTEPKKFRRNLHPGEIPSSVGATPKCTYFNKALKIWSSEGCKLVSDGPYSATCACNHLSAFSILSQAHEYIGKTLALKLTTLVGPSMPILLMVQKLYSNPPEFGNWVGQFEKLLMVFFIVQNLAFVVFIDKEYFFFSKDICYLIGLICHLLFLFGFHYMFIVTLDILLSTKMSKMSLLLAKFGNLMRNALYKKLVYLSIVFLFPLFIVGITAIIGAVIPNSRAYGGEFCWLDGGYLWAFYGPAIFIFTVNISLILYYKVIVFRSKQKEDSSAELSIKLSLITQFSLLLVLTWTIAFYQIGSSLVDSSFLAFLFPLINALQGLLLYILTRSEQEKQVGLFNSIRGLVNPANLIGEATEQLQGTVRETMGHQQNAMNIGRIPVNGDTTPMNCDGAINAQVHEQVNGLRNTILPPGIVKGGNLNELREPLADGTAQAQQDKVNELRGKTGSTNVFAQHGPKLEINPVQTGINSSVNLGRTLNESTETFI